VRSLSRLGGRTLNIPLEPTRLPPELRAALSFFGTSPCPSSTLYGDDFTGSTMYSSSSRRTAFLPSSFLRRQLRQLAAFPRARASASPATAAPLARVDVGKSPAAFTGLKNLNAPSPLQSLLHL